MVESKLLSTLRLNQKGQGMIEYILLLVITVSMVLLALANVFRPLQSFMQDYMGTYVACMLSSGELPAIRTENQLKDSDPKCNFSIAMGQGGNGTGGSGSGSGNSNDPNDPNGKGKGAKGSGGAVAEEISKSGNGDSSTNGSGNGAYAGGNSGRSAFGKSTFLRRSSDGKGGASDGSDDSKRYVNNLDKRGQNDRFYGRQQRRTPLAGRFGRGIAIGGITEEEQRKIERKIQVESRVVPKSSEDFSVPPKKVILKPQILKEKKTLEEKNEVFSLGNIFKYVLIAAVLLLILILGGGQAFEMSKTME